MTAQKNPDDIPRTIHYCWFGGNPLGEQELRCMESWRKYLPGYEIVCWDESNFDIRCCDYVSEAYDAKKWAFVSDYARFKILYERGGLYFDTDVELVQPIDDILANGPFMGFEVDSDGIEVGSVNAGLGLSVGPGLDLYRSILDSYENDHFVKDDKSFDQTTVVIRVTRILEQNGLKPLLGIQDVAGVTIYPAEYFNPKDMYTGEIRITSNTRSIHHFSMSWFTEKDIFEHNIGRHLRKIGLPEKMVFKLCAVAEVVRFADLERVLKRVRG